MKIAMIVGARPQFIKAAAVSRAIVAHNRDASRLTPDSLRLTPNSSPLTEILIHTGQHYDDGMSANFQDLTPEADLCSEWLSMSKTTRK